MGFKGQLQDGWMLRASAVVVILALFQHGARADVRDLELARLDTECTTYWQLVARHCEDRLEPLVRSGVQETRPLVERFIELETPLRKPSFEKWRTWLDLVRDHPDKRERFTLVLGEDDELLLTWSLDEFVGDSDPQRWNPADVAFLVHEVRLMARRPVGEGMYVVGGIPGPTARYDELLVLHRLSPMGVHRTFELVSEERQQPDASPHLDMARVRAELKRLETGR